MKDSAFEAPRCHVLLVGIEDYAVKPLRGCLNDIDAIHDLLVSQGGLPAAQIRRLASPLGGARPAAERATYANIRAALTDLAGNQVEADHRVFVAIACHGTRVPVVTSSGRQLHREALVPIDVDEDRDRRRLLFDHEINTLLRAILARTRNLAVFLDCCNSAGVTRREETMTSRSLDPVEDLELQAPIAIPDSMADGGAIGSGLDDCHVVAACLEHEQAQELAGAHGVHHGLLTRAFIDAVRDLSAQQLWTTPWSQIWSTIRDRIEDRNPAQHPWMSGGAGRFVLAGPPVERDPGIEVMRIPDTDQYEVAAGTLAGVTSGAKLAVYGERPAYFPELGSAADEAARVGVIEIRRATRSRAGAVAVGAPFDPPVGARGRLVATGEPARLRCAIVPPEPQVVQQLAQSSLLDVVEPPRAHVRLERGPDGWALVDDVHGVGPVSPLLALLDDELVHARAVLEHYACYAVPLRMGTGSTDLPGALEVSVLACPPHGLDPATAQEPDLPLAGTLAGATYDLVDGARVGVRVRNGSRQRLRVALIDAAPSGKVRLFGDHVIDAGGNQMFWRGAVLGSPFGMSVPRGMERACERLVAIGRTRMDSELGHLQSNTRFADLVPRLRMRPRGSEDSDRDRSPVAAPPAELWTATQVLLVTRRT